ncbi:hypothetical protein [Rathayibacter rathayi]|uniref:hypothetical protein n=1 Tax=Rathayibacter rathayi TaxID=33887 RepID=UPI000CE8ACBB|nr:hypothetical protein [Rathayibacter rathayi]PPG10311.1 hypothetical protein C5C11_14300 [Rathayibacter rathayi]PPG45025.1 hypothetical protein C5C20_06225 [Rathayibacter rathayi]PPG89684.1 hypothetical protein C5C47_03460 [Rathayibacter rathayi]PPG92660.1 hypothetical protein C5C00_14330 [Rathayibacter rathayi]PPH97107.1 hypothetical protein C5C43_13795 [Rathayibacter rathayi]
MPLRSQTALALAALVAIAAVLAALLGLGRQGASALVRLTDAGEIPARFAVRDRRTGVPAAASSAAPTAAAAAILLAGLLIARAFRR